MRCPGRRSPRCCWLSPRTHGCLGWHKGVVGAEGGRRDERGSCQHCAIQQTGALGLGFTRVSEGRDEEAGEQPCCWGEDRDKGLGAQRPFGQSLSLPLGYLPQGADTLPNRLITPPPPDSPPRRGRPHALKTCIPKFPLASVLAALRCWWFPAGPRCPAASKDQQCRAAARARPLPPALLGFLLFSPAIPASRVGRTRAGCPLSSSLALHPRRARESAISFVSPVARKASPWQRGRLRAGCGPPGCSARGGTGAWLAKGGFGRSPWGSGGREGAAAAAAARGTAGSPCPLLDGVGRLASV